MHGNWQLASGGVRVAECITIAGIPNVFIAKIRVASNLVPALCMPLTAASRRTQLPPNNRPQLSAMSNIPIWPPSARAETNPDTNAELGLEPSSKQLGMLR